MLFVQHLGQGEQALQQPVHIGGGLTKKCVILRPQNYILKRAFYYSFSQLRVEHSMIPSLANFFI